MNNIKKKIKNIVKVILGNYEIKNIKDLEHVVNVSYKEKNTTMIKFYINNLVTLKDKKTNQHIFKINDFMKYVKVVNNKFIIDDDENEFLTTRGNKDALKFYSKVKYFEYMNSDKEPLFLTFTNPSQFHFYKYNKTKTKLIKNYKCSYDSLGETIDNSFININKIKRDYYKLVKEYLKRKGMSVNFDYISILEAHANRSIHNHQVIFISKDQISIFKQAFDVIIRRHKLKQTRFIIIDRTKSKPTTYLMKYLLKTTQDNFYKKFRKYFSKYRFFTSSNIGFYNQNVLDIIQRHLKTNELSTYNKYLKDSKPLLVSIIEHIQDNYIVNYIEDDYIVNNYDRLKEFLKFIKTNKNYNDSYLLEDYCLDNLDVVSRLIDKKTIKLKSIFRIEDKNYYNKIIYEKKEYIEDETLLNGLKVC